MERNDDNDWRSLRRMDERAIQASLQDGEGYPHKPYRNDYRKVMAENMQKNIDKIFPRGKAVWRLLKTSKTIW